MQLQEAGAESPAHGLSAGISPGRVLGGEEHEMRMRLDHFMQLWDEELLIVIQKPAALEAYILCNLQWMTPGDVKADAAQ